MSCAWRIFRNARAHAAQRADGREGEVLIPGYGVKLE